MEKPHRLQFLLQCLKRKKTRKNMTSLRISFGLCCRRDNRRHTKNLRLRTSKLQLLGRAIETGVSAMDSPVLTFLIIAIIIFISFVLCCLLRRRINYSGHVVSAPRPVIVQQMPQREVVHQVNIVNLSNSGTTRPMATTQMVMPSPSAPPLTVYHDQPPQFLNQNFNEYQAPPPSYTSLYPQNKQ
uniref:Uncharacterized protein n=1 Tax=Strigamia maritima TaxID=126957 RepID=T1IVM2_STRMM